MSIQDWGAIGEIVGALAVVGSLIYLAVQIRQNTRQISQSIESAKLAAFERTVESSNHAREVLITNTEVTDLFLKGAADYLNLPPPDKFRCEMLFRNLLSAVQGGYIRELAMGGDPAKLEGIRNTLNTLLKNPGVRQWLGEVETDWRSEFADFVTDCAKVYD